MFNAAPSPVTENELCRDAENYLRVFCNRVEVTQDTGNKDRYRFSLSFDQGVVTVGALFEGTDKKDFAFTHMTTIPTTSLGYGSSAVSALIQWAHHIGCHKIFASQVNSESESFWVKNGFVEDEANAATGDYVYKY